MDKENTGQPMDLGQLLIKKRDQITTHATDLITGLLMSQKFGEDVDSYPDEDTLETYYNSIVPDIINCILTLTAIDVCDWEKANYSSTLPASSVFLKFLAFMNLNHGTELKKIEFDGEDAQHIQALRDDLDNFYDYDALVSDADMTAEKVKKMKGTYNFHILCLDAEMKSLSRVELVGRIYVKVKMLLEAKSFREAYLVHNQFRARNGWHISSNSQTKQ